jgi:tetratricopeptide (TPR) repeat protein
MRKARFIIIGLMLALASAAPHALADPPTPADAEASRTQPAFGPAPAWVVPVTPANAASAANGEAMTILLHDQQTLLEPGRQTVYNEIAVRIDSAAGLAVGNLSYPWRPETDLFTVHKLRIRRGDEIIDVLESGQTFAVMRREQNLDLAMLDGVLTANIQPEGLEVGDILEMAASVIMQDPVLGEHVETTGAFWNSVIARAHLSVQWPDSVSVLTRVTPGLPAPRVTRRGGMTRFELTADNVQPINPPAGAPIRFAIGRMAEFTSFESWADLAAMIRPLYMRAGVIPESGPLHTEMTRIQASSGDPLVRAQAALSLVQDRVRYVALLMGEGGLVPADAATTWARRYGDCKAKTALLLALLRGLDIEAEAVAANTIVGDGLDQRLPMVAAFDHVLVRANIAGRTYWLDGTRNGDRLDQLQVPNLAWALPLTENDAALVHLAPAPLETPSVRASVRIDASEGILSPAPIHAEYILHGDAAILGDMAYANLTPDQRDRQLRDYWREEYDDLDITSVTLSFDRAAREQRFTMDGRIRMDFARGGYEADGALGFRAEFSRDPGPNADAPFAVNYPMYFQTTKTIVLPPGQTGFHIQSGEDVDQTVAGVTYHRRASISGNTFSVETSTRSIAPEFPASEAQAAQTTLRALSDRATYLIPPTNYQPTEADIAFLTSTTPTDAAGFVQRARLYLQAGQDGEHIDQASNDFDRALAINPRHVQALLGRAVIHMMRGQTAAANADFDAAEAIAPNDHRVTEMRARMSGAILFSIIPGVNDEATLQALAANAPTAAEIAAAAPMANPEWEQRPTEANFAQFYPPAALARGLEGHAVLDCIIGGDGRSRCAIAEEEPSDAGFGLAALGIAQSLRMRESQNSEPTAGRRVRVPITFRMMDDDKPN